MSGRGQTNARSERTLDTYFDQERKPDGESCPPRSGPPMRARNSFVEYGSCLLLSLAYGSLNRNWTASCIAGRRLDDRMRAAGWRLNALAAETQVLMAHSRAALHDLCFWGDEGRLACCYSDGLYTTNFDATDPQLFRLESQTEGHFVMALTSNCVACASRVSNKIRLVSPYGEVHHPFQRGGRQRLSYTQGFAQLDVLCETSILASDGYKQIFEWDLRTARTPHQAYRFEPDMEGQQLNAPVVSIQSAMDENLVIGITLDGKLWCWDMRMAYESIVYLLHTKKLFPPEQGTPLYFYSSAGPTPTLLSAKLRPENPRKLAFLGETVQGRVAGLVDLPSLGIEHLKLISPSPLRLQPMPAVYQSVAWDPTEQGIITGNDRAELCFVNFRGQPDTRTDVSAGVVKRPAAGDIVCVECDSVNEAVVYGTWGGNVLRVN